VITVPERYRQTDRQTTDCGITALKHRAVKIAAQIAATRTFSLLSAGGEVLDQDDPLARFAVIKTINVDNVTKLAYSARRYDNKTTYYICQKPQQGLFKLY